MKILVDNGTMLRYPYVMETMLDGTRLHLRITPEQKAMFEKAANKETLRLSQWVRHVLIAAARQTLNTP